MAPKKSPEVIADEPSPSFLKSLEKATAEMIGKLLDIPDRPQEEKLKPLTLEQVAQLQEIEYRAIRDYSGDLTQLEAALGMLRIGHHFGWKVLYILHSKRTIRNYEEILGIRIREIFEPEGPSSYRSFGFNIAGRFRNFWKVAGGDIKIPHRQSIQK